MYKYDDYDRTIVKQRVAEFRGQVERNLAGELSDEELMPLRLRNGLYFQTHAPMLRVAIPYGLLNSDQVRTLSMLATKYDKGYAHFTTRQNIQYNWPELKDVPDMLDHLADVEMHAIQTSGNCIRNITADQYAGVALDEIEDPRAYCEILRQWSTLHPEFYWLPRKFKIAITIGLQMLVGGGLGRTPVIGKVIHEFLPKEDVISYCEAILRVYNLHGRRDNKYKARIKILVNALGIEEFKRQVEAEWDQIKDSNLKLQAEDFERMQEFFPDPAYEQFSAEELTESTQRVEKWRSLDTRFQQWYENNTREHKQAGYRIVDISLKEPGIAPGDATDEQMNAVADIADQYSMGEVRVTHEQNLVLADVQLDQL